MWGLLGCCAAIDLALWRILTSRSLVSYLDDQRSLPQELTM